MAWPYVYSPDIWLPLFTFFLLIALCAYSLRRRSVPDALPFAIGSLLTALWAFGSVMQYAAIDLEVKTTWVKFQAIWQVPATTAITCFILEFAWPGRWLTRRNLFLLFIVPLLNIVAILTADLHHLEWLGFRLDGSVIPLYGPGSWSFLAYIYVLGLVNFIVFTWLFVHVPRQRSPVIR